MPVSTAQTIVTDAKHRGRVADRDDRLHNLLDDVLTVAQQGTTKLLERAQAGILNSRDITLGRRLTQMTTQAAYLNNALSRKPAPDPAPTPDEDQSSRKLERMLQDLRDEKGESDGPPQPTTKGSSPNATNCSKSSRQ